jgi:acyl-CoA thioester hydrolase
MSEPATEKRPHGAVSLRAHEARVRVRYGETDQMGVVYYANYLRYFEVGRAEWLRAGGLPYKQIEDEGAMFPVIEAHVRYRQPARYDEEIIIEVRPTRVGSASMRFEYIVRRDQTVLCEGWSDHACIDKTGRPKRIPASVKALFIPTPSDENS